MKKFLSVLLSLVFIVLLIVPAFAQEKPFDNSFFYTQGDYTIHYRYVKHEGAYKGRIMMLHGFGQSSYSWENMAAEMSAKGYDCYMADQPCFGYSTRESADINHIDREELILSLMKSIANDRNWILAGHSMGGGVAINIAEETGLRALLLFCAAPTSETAPAMDKLVTSKIMTSFMEFMMKYMTRLTLLMRIVVFGATVNFDFAKNYDVEKVSAPLQQDGTGKSLAYMMISSRETDLENTDKITCPVLLINGDRDLIINKSMKQSISDAFPNAERYTVKGGGHICLEDRAAELADVTYSFLNK